MASRSPGGLSASPTSLWEQGRTRRELGERLDPGLLLNLGLKMRVRESHFREGRLIRAGEEWQGLLGARQLVGCSVQDLLALPVLWNGKFPRRERRRSGLAGRGRSGLERNRLGGAVRTRGLIAQQSVAADDRPAVASLRGLPPALAAERERTSGPRWTVR